MFSYDVSLLCCGEYVSIYIITCFEKPSLLRNVNVFSWLDFPNHSTINQFPNSIISVARLLYANFEPTERIPVVANRLIGELRVLFSFDCLLVFIFETSLSFIFIVCF